MIGKLMRTDKMSESTRTSQSRKETTEGLIAKADALTIYSM